MKIPMALALLFLSGSCSAASRCLKYEDATVSLTGRVVVRTFFGPPGYGEHPKTDSIEQQAILVLDHPVCVDASGGDEAAASQSEITLVPLGSVDMSRYIGKRVTVAGSLFHAISGHHYTKVLIQLKQPPALPR
jgi:hypothetical protein